MINDFYKAWRYLDEHPIFNKKVTFNLVSKVFGIKTDLNNTDDFYFESHFDSCLDIEVVKVNPVTMAIDDDENLNTKVQIWLEAGPYKKECGTHDYDLDCGADTFEQAIIELANLVQKKYGDDYEKAMQLVKDQYGE